MLKRWYTNINKYRTDKEEKLRQEEELLKQAYLESKKPVYEPITPYWMIVGDYEPKFFQKLDEDVIKAKKERIRREQEREEQERHQTYVTSGGQDMSFDSLPTVHPGSVPAFCSPGMQLYNGVGELFLQHQTYIKDAVRKLSHFQLMSMWLIQIVVDVLTNPYCLVVEHNSEVEHTYFLLNKHGHKVYKVTERLKGNNCCRLRDLIVTDCQEDRQTMRYKYGCTLRYVRVMRAINIG